MLDSYNRPITYIRISVTERCNLRCVYCMPEEDTICTSEQKTLSFDNLMQVVTVAADMGMEKVRITGGEPLVRQGVPEFIGRIKALQKVQFVGMTTNGTLLRKYKQELQQSGVDRINLSLDTLHADRYKTLTRGGDIEQVFDGIFAMKEANIPIKINMVITKESTAQEIEEMKAFTQKEALELQLIKEYRLSTQKDDDHPYHRPPHCGGCNKIRILSNGIIKPCLHSDIEIPLDMNHIQESLEYAIGIKPLAGSSSQRDNIAKIGG